MSNIVVYDPLTNAPYGNGAAVLVPTKGRIKQVAGGEYSFTMEHPIDPWGKWKHLKREAIVRLPVPTEIIPNSFTGVAVDIYKATGNAPLRESPQDPSVVTYTAWERHHSYDIGDKVTHDYHNYQCIRGHSADVMGPPPHDGLWVEIARTAGGAVILTTLKTGTEVYFVEDAGDGWYKVKTSYGLTGYVHSASLQYVRTTDPDENQPRVITEQLFRIREVKVDKKNGSVSVTGRHVSNDLNGNLVKELKLSKASPALAIARIYENLLLPYPGIMATDMVETTDGTYTADIKRKNPMNCLTDPDTGVVPTFKAKLTRDNWDLFIMNNPNTDKGYQIRYAKNTNGISWKINTEKLVTLVMPVAKDKDGNDLLLPEVYVQSTHLSEYPVAYLSTLNVKGQVDKDDGTETGTKWTETALLDEMRAKAGEEFSVKEVDIPVTEVTVQLEQLENTPEYAWLKPLLNVVLYDVVTVKDAEIGLNQQLSVTEIEWDYVGEKITGVKLSSVSGAITRTVAGYSVMNAALTANKMDASMTDEIRAAAQNQVEVNWDEIVYEAVTKALYEADQRYEPIS